MRFNLILVGMVGLIGCAAALPENLKAFKEQGDELYALDPESGENLERHLGHAERHLKSGKKGSKKAKAGKKAGVSKGKKSAKTKKSLKSKKRSPKTTQSPSPTPG